MKQLQILQSLSKVISSHSASGRRLLRSPVRATSGTLTDELDRILYGLGSHEQFVVKRVVSMTGQDVTVRNHTVGIGKKNTPRYLTEGTQLKISASPLAVDRQGEILINLLDENNKPLAIRISDYIQDVYVNSRGPDVLKTASVHPHPQP